MKICPFVSHLLGDDGPNALTLDGDANASQSPSNGSSEDVVILGYEGGSDSTPANSTPAGGSTDSMASHLYCLKKSCRFYHAKNGECQFDLIFHSLEDAKKRAEDTKLPDLSKDIDKIWKFQTQSVSELVKSIADSEKTQAKNLGSFKAEVEKGLKELTSQVDKSSGKEAKKEISTLNKRLEERNEGLDNLSTTMSDLVLSLQETLGTLQENTKNMQEQIAEIDRDMPRRDVIGKIVSQMLNEELQSLKLPDVEEPLDELRKDIERVIEEQRDASPNAEIILEKSMEAHARAQKEIEQRVAESHREMSDQLRQMMEQQQSWEERLSALANQHEELSTYLENGKRIQESEKARMGKKEAKKFNNLGVTSFHNGAFEMAKDQFLEAVRMDPDFAEAYNNLGLAYTEMGAEEHATEAFQRAIEINPDLQAAYNNLGYIFFKQGNYTQAIEMYNEALGRSSDNSSAYTNLGNAYYKLGKAEEAENAWSKALELDPGNEKARRNLQRIREEIS